MLAGVEPDLLVAAAYFDAVDRLAFQAMPKRPYRDTFKSGGLRDQIMVPFDAVRREIGKPDDIAACGIADRKGAAFLVVTARRAAPIFPVFADAGVIICLLYTSPSPRD